MDDPPLDTISPMVLIMNPAHGNSSSFRSTQPKYRAPTVEEALPLTPLTSIVPVAHGEFNFPIGYTPQDLACDNATALNSHTLPSLFNPHSSSL
jgi:hypothetical protein